MMSGSREWNLNSMLKKLLSPSIIAIAIGLICFLFQLMVPKVVYQAVSYIANINTPFAMLIAGVTIGRTSIFKLIKKYRIFYVALIKLILIPILLLFIYSRFAIDEMVLITAIIMAAAPSATIGILFAIKYEKDSVLAAEIFTVTTLLSAFTIPFLVKLAGLVL